ncbi:MAG: hypothetical protein AB1689_03970 [Thermodesulfobacteriota bacterium]
MSLDLMKEKGVPIEEQSFTLRELTPPPISKLDDDAFTRVRIILMNGLESHALRFKHACAWFSRDLRVPLAAVRRAEQHQQTMVNWLLPADQSVLETTIGFEQVAIEVTASLALNEPDPYMAQTYRFGLLEDFDHLYRYAALMDRVDGKDANNILQSYTDILPGRPTMLEHRAPVDEIRRPYDRATVHPVSRLNALTLVGAEYQTHDYYMTVGPTFADPVARGVYAEIASIEEQHVTQYESLIDPDETWLEKWVLQEAVEAYNYWSCVNYEGNARVKQIWQRFLDYELGHLHLAMDLMKSVERRDPAEILPASFPEPVRFESHREFVRETLANEVHLRARGSEFIPSNEEQPDSPSVLYRQRLNSEGTPTEIVAAGYRWMPGTELAGIAPGAAAAVQGEVRP